MNRVYEAENYLVMGSQNVVDRLLDEESDNVADLETFIKRPFDSRLSLSTARSSMMWSCSDI